MTNQININEKSITEHQKSHFSANDIVDLRHQLARDGFIKVREIVPNSVRQELREEVLRLLGTSSERRDLLLETTDNTPRHMSIVRSEDIDAQSEYIPALAQSPALMHFLEEIAGEKFYTASDDLIKDDRWFGDGNARAETVAMNGGHG